MRATRPRVQNAGLGEVLPWLPARCCVDLDDNMVTGTLRCPGDPHLEGIRVNVEQILPAAGYSVYAKINVPKQPLLPEGGARLWAYGCQMDYEVGYTVYHSTPVGVPVDLPESLQLDWSPPPPLSPALPRDICDYCLAHRLVGPQCSACMQPWEEQPPWVRDATLMRDANPPPYSYGPYKLGPACPHGQSMQCTAWAPIAEPPWVTCVHKMCMDTDAAPTVRPLAAPGSARGGIPSHCKPGEWPCGPHGLCCPGGSCREHNGHWGCTGPIRSRPSAQPSGISLKRGRLRRNQRDAMAASFEKKKNPRQPRGCSLARA